MSMEKFSGAALRVGDLNGMWLGPRPSLRSKDADLTKLVIGAPPPLVMGGRVVPSLGSDVEVTPASLIGGGLTNNAWHYLFAYVSGGVLAYEVDRTAPDASLIFNSADQSRRYIGPFRTDGSAGIVPGSLVGGSYLYDFAWGANFFKFLSLGVATSTTLVALADSVSTTALLVPPHARQARIRANVHGDGSHQESVILYSNGSSTLGFHTDSFLASSAIDQYESMDIMTDANHKVGYAVSNASRISLTLWALGFYEKT